MISSLEPFLLGLVFFDLLYRLVSLALTDRFFLTASKSHNPAFYPPVSIIVPVKGEDEGLYENFMALCRQDYPLFQVIFAVETASDPAVVVIHQVIRDCPGRDLSMVISHQKVGVNEKVNNLENGCRQARYEYLVLIDSDIRIAQDYLKQIIPPLSDDRVGLVTCIPVYRDSQNMPAAFETIGVNSNIFSLSVPAFIFLGELRYACGATIAMRRKVLEEIGGFKSVADHAADDAALARLVRSNGYGIYLSPYLIYTVHSRDSWKDYFYHTLRWNRTILAIAPGIYLGFALFFGTFYAFLYWMIHFRDFGAFAVFLLVSFLRIVATSYYNDCAIKDASTQRYLWLVPIRDLTWPLEWLFGFAGRTIHWRGIRYRIRSGGRLERIA